jgi:hypothetical protein
VRKRDVPSILHFTEIYARNRDVARESAKECEAVARHLLIQTAIAPACFAKNAFAAGHYGRDNDLFSNPCLVPGHHGS